MRKPCCEKQDTNKGAWSKQEDQKLIDYIRKNGEGCWRTLPQAAGLLRCGKSCRLRWINYLRPDLKRGNFAEDEEDLIIKLHALLGNRWSLIAGRLPGRTDNEVKNYWNSHLRRKLANMGIDPNNHKLAKHPSLYHPAQSQAPVAGRNDGSKSATKSSNFHKSNNGVQTAEDEQPKPAAATNCNIIINSADDDDDDDGQAISEAASSLEEAPCSSSLPDLNLDLMISTPSSHPAGQKSNPSNYEDQQRVQQQVDAAGGRWNSGAPAPSAPGGSAYGSVTSQNQNDASSNKGEKAIVERQGKRKKSLSSEA
uniref:Uncharacterized protein n=1 Tax=Kalanchoe fedtschenkoi TaxID=63787 RepID=A0A7N0V4T3_KALFE